MRLGYFSMPLHPLGRTWADTLREDRDAVILADPLGFHDAFIGEHLTDKHENITNSLLFLATLIHDTDADPARRPAPPTSPTSTRSWWRSNSAMFDHLSDGRFILGVSPGRAVLRRRGRSASSTRTATRCSREAIDVITAVWEREPPYDIDLPGNRFKVTHRDDDRPGDGRGGRAQAAAAARGRRSSGPWSRRSPRASSRWGQKDFHPLSANFLLPQWVATHWPNYVQGKESVGWSGRPRRLADRPDDLRRRRRHGGRAATAGRPAQPVPVLLLADAHEDEQAGTSRAVQDAAGTSPTTRSPSTTCSTHLVITGTPERWPSRSWPSATRSATSASSCTPDSTGSTPTSAAARWS